MTEPQVHPHILATGEPDSVTHYVCPEAPKGAGSPTTHHLRPSYRGAGTGTYVQQCTYCGKTELQLRQEVGL